MSPPVHRRLGAFVVAVGLAVLCLTAPPAAASPNDLPGAIRSILHATPVQDARTGVIVSDLETGEVVFARNADELLNPASNVKIVTVVAALARLGPHYRYPTEVYLGGPIVDGVVQGDVYLKGKGDPSLTAERLYRIVRELRHLGVREIAGNVVADDSYFDDQYEGPGWEQDDSDRPYMAGAGALSLNLNAVEVRVYPGSAPGQPGRVVVEPDSDFIVVQERVQTAPRGARSRVQVSSEPEGRRQRIRVNARLPVGHSGVITYRRISNPPFFAAQTFRSLLQEQQIKVRGTVRKGVTPENLRPAHVDWSEPLALLVHRLNKWSQNHMAEMLLKTLGAEELGSPGTWDKGILAVENFLDEEVGIPKGSLVLRNGSGLNDTNRFSARQILRILEWGFHSPQVGPELLTSLPIAGVDGTTRNRLVGTGAEGKVRAKTGTLQNVTALSGYAFSPAGKPYAFAIVVNDYPGRLSRILPGVDAIGAAIASVGSPEGTEAALAFAKPVTPDPSTPTEVLRNRVETFQALAHPDRNNATFLRAALRTEPDPALRAVIAEALYRAEPDDPSTASLFIENFSTSDEVLGRLRQLDPNTLPSVLVTVIDLAAQGSTTAIAHLLDVADGLPEGDPLAGELAAGLAEVGRTAPEELLESLEDARPESQLKLLRWVARGFSPWQEKPAEDFVGPLPDLSGGARPVSQTLAHEGADPRLSHFARSIELRLAEEAGSEGSGETAEGQGGEAEEESEVESGGASTADDGLTSAEIPVETAALVPGP